MACLFQPLEAGCLTRVERPVFRAFRGILEATGNSQDNAAQLTKKIISTLEPAYQADTQENGEGEQSTIHDIWRIMFDIIYRIPPDHEWQDTWTLTLSTLAQ
ncbi:hypothetical protein F4678DRAFT_457817 [Xylaria arbuscula]|nr:hypothetical protein F4678DRAFT_457817 [Xylaria arbuscula]